MMREFISLRVSAEDERFSDKTRYLSNEDKYENGKKTFTHERVGTRSSR
jgi:hypothetical protein